MAHAQGTEDAALVIIPIQVFHTPHCFFMISLGNHHILWTNGNSYPYVLTCEDQP